MKVKLVEEGAPAVLSCCGYRMFKGKLKFRVSGDRYTVLYGTFVYLPDDDVWMNEAGNQFDGGLCEIGE